MMIRKIAFFLTLAILIPIFSSNVSAHVLKYDGSIGAVVHVNPEDDPIAGEVSNFFFEFKDKNGKFIPENCDCKVKILKEGAELYNQNLFQNNSTPSLTNISFSYTFPSLGIYGVIIEGTSKDQSFNNFTLKYDVRVARISNSVAVDQTQQTNWFLDHKIHIILPVVIALITLVLFFLTRKRK